MSSQTILNKYYNTRKRDGKKSGKGTLRDASVSTEEVKIVTKPESSSSKTIRSVGKESNQENSLSCEIVRAKKHIVQVTISKTHSKARQFKLDELSNEGLLTSVDSKKNAEIQSELQKLPIIFSEKTKNKGFQSNKSAITAVASLSSPTKYNATILPLKSSSETKGYLPVDSSSLVLPQKYRMLFEMFHSMDTVVCIMHNRKERIIFERVQENVQRMLKRNFNKTHVGQIMTIAPSAYHIVLERSISQKLSSQQYELVITPNLEKDTKQRPYSFIRMHPQCLMDRKAEFNFNLIAVVKMHHQEFLKELKFPVVPDIKKWHPKFQVDSVPDIPSAPLPEPPKSKIITAKDALNIVKEAFKSKFEKKLQSIADEAKLLNVSIEVPDTPPPKSETSKNAFKGICTDNLEKVRARESTMHLETMTRGPDETKQLAMLKRLPKMVKFLWQFFISEHKAAVPLDIAVEKIIRIFDSLMTPDDAEEHMKLITVKFPGWLKFIEIRESVYIKIDKRKSINKMLDNFKH